MIYWKCIVWKWKTPTDAQPHVALTLFGESTEQLNSITDTIIAYWDIGKVWLHYSTKSQDKVPDVIKDMLFIHMAFISTSKALPSNSTYNMREQFEYIFPITSKNEDKRYSGKSDLDEFLIEHRIVSRNQEDKQEREQHNAIIRNEKVAVSAYKERLANPIKRRTAEESMERVQAKQREAEEAMLQEWQQKMILSPWFKWIEPWAYWVIRSLIPTPNSEDPTQPMPGETTEQYILRMQSLRTWSWTTTSQSQ